MVDRETALRSLSFGFVDSESEADLDRKFIRTADFDRFVGPGRTDLVLGPKGSGKTALFRLFERHEDEARRLASPALDDVVIQSANGTSDLQRLAGVDLTGVMTGPGADDERLWSAFIAWKAAEAIGTTDLRVRGELRRFLRASSKRSDLRIVPIFHRLWRRMVSDHPPQKLKITLFGTGLDAASTVRPWDVRDMLQEVNDALARSGKTVWILIDNLDELLSTQPTSRTRSVSALFAKCNQIRLDYPRIQPRLFLRTDIWADLEFTNKSHWSDKQLSLRWSPSQLLGLMLKRAVSVPEVQQLVATVLPKVGSPSDIDDLSPAERQAALFLLFEPSMEGTDVLSWMLQRCADGHGEAMPRELIILGNEAKARAEVDGVRGDVSLIPARALRAAFPEMSRIRVETFLTEFPRLRPHFRRLQLKPPRFHRNDLEQLMSGLRPSGKAMLEELCEVGVIAPVDGHLETSDHFAVPLLYRPGLRSRQR